MTAFTLWSWYNYIPNSGFKTSCTLIPALPFCHFEINAKKLSSKAYPKALLTLGDHTRKKRLDLNLHQIDASKIVKADEMTIVGWELDHCQPLVGHLPNFNDFLGYVPEDVCPANTLGQKIKRYRLLHGMTRLQIAKQFHIDEVALDKLENDKGRHFQETLNKIADLLKSAG